MAALTATIQTAQNMMIGISSTTSPIVLMRIEKKERGTEMYVGGKIKSNLFSFDSEDCAIAVRAGHAMAERFQEDMAITQELAVVKLSECREPPLEIIRFKGRLNND